MSLSPSNVEHTFNNNSGDMLHHVLRHRYQNLAWLWPWRRSAWRRASIILKLRLAWPKSRDDHDEPVRRSPVGYDRVLLSKSLRRISC